LTEEDFKKRYQRWKNRNNEMKERKPDADRKKDTKEIPRRKQMALSRLRTGYTKATHGPKMERVSNPLCIFCNIHLSVDHILWECKEAEDQRTWTWIKNNGSTGKRYGIDDCLRKRNRTVQRNIGMENNRKVSKIIPRRKGTNQDGDDNEEIRRRTDEDTHGISI
jgi:hypothetical protein